MFSFIKKLFSGKKEKEIKLEHEKLGVIQFVHSGNYWETSGGEIFHSIPGDERGPNTKSIEFVLSKIERIDSYWEKCSKELLDIVHDWEAIDKNLSVRELFKLSAISVNSDDNTEWEICFETIEPNKWVSIGLHFQGEEMVANDICT